MYGMSVQNTMNNKDCMCNQTYKLARLVTVQQKKNKKEASQARLVVTTVLGKKLAISRVR